MPISLENASAIAAQQISAMSEQGSHLVVLTDATEEYEEGWVFYYQAASYLDSQDAIDALAGNAPLFVARSDGAFFVLSYHRLLTESLAAYRVCGDPNAIQLPEIRVKTWCEGARAVDAIRLLRQYTGIGLARAKEIVDNCFDDLNPTLTVSSVSTAQELVLALKSTGFCAEVVYGMSPKYSRKEEMLQEKRNCTACGRSRDANETFCPYCTSRPSPQRLRQRSATSRVDTHLETRWGGGSENPTVDELRAALVELSVVDEEHPDTWLVDENGWCVVVSAGGDVVLSNDNGDVNIHRTGVSTKMALELWLLLQRGAIDEIQRILSADPLVTKDTLIGRLKAHYTQKLTSWQVVFMLVGTVVYLYVRINF
ncbi:YrhB domain-containing protein [Undibacterium cyanobacteriorum]|uniref:YrhB domain-containing protein n=1 Tax=Undibacterium cyanobacteriorum TaxID=3073561 RepID=A0ABY9RH57_9BURK|nr:YrhB domain-containing protein [Undibacterium sp. 20NA77.5]WMW79615.1 YrhB domain-containing protein [Undibacterium sp. 20NA77.5]